VRLAKRDARHLKLVRTNLRGGFEAKCSCAAGRTTEARRRSLSVRLCAREKLISSLPSRDFPCRNRLIPTSPCFWTSAKSGGTGVPPVFLQTARARRPCPLSKPKVCQQRDVGMSRFRCLDGMVSSPATWLRESEAWHESRRAKFSAWPLTSRRSTLTVLSSWSATRSSTSPYRCGRGLGLAVSTGRRRKRC
jgi:hypothetical protein